MNVANISPEQRAVSWLASGDVRATKQRMALAELLVGDGIPRHLTAESLFESAQAVEAQVSLATVYNTLRTFCDAGLMKEVTVDGKGSYFDTRLDDHPHYYWEDDQTLTDAPNDAVTFAGTPIAPDGTVISKIDVVIRVKRT